MDSLLLKLLTNSLRKRQTSLDMPVVTFYLTAPLRFESQNREDRKNGVRKWEELLEEEKTWALLHCLLLKF